MKIEDFHFGCSGVRVFGCSGCLKEKCGATNLAIGKMIGLILAAIVLVMLLSLASEGNSLVDGLRQKGEEIGYMISSVVKSDLYYECNDGKVSEITGGKSLLGELGASEAVFAACEDGACEFEYGDVKFRLNEDKLEKEREDDWVDYSFVQGLEISDLKEDWEKFDLGVEFLKENGVYDLYGESLTRRFVLYGDGNCALWVPWSMDDQEVYTVWQSGEWMIQKRGEVPEYFWSDDDAIDNFEGEVWDSYSDRVNWTKESGVTTMEDVYVSQADISGMSLTEACSAICQDGDIGKCSSSSAGAFGSGLSCNGFIRNEGMCCCYWDVFGVYGGKSFSGERIDSLVGGNNNGRIDSDEEVENLKVSFAEIKGGLLDEVVLSSEELGRFEALVGKVVEIGGKSYEVSLYEYGSNYFPIVVFRSSDDEFGLRLGAFADLYSDYFEGEKLDYDPVYLVELRTEKVSSSDGVVTYSINWEKSGDENLYRLSEEDMLELYRAKLVADFLEGKCK